MQTPFIALLDDVSLSDPPHYKKTILVFRNIDILPRTADSDMRCSDLLDQSDEIVLNLGKIKSMSDEWARLFVRLRIVAYRLGKTFSIIGASDEVIDLYENIGLYNVMCDSFHGMETPCLLENF